MNRTWRIPPQLTLSRPLPVPSCVDPGLDSLCTKQDVASFRIQYIGVEGERIGTKAFGSGVQSLLVPSGYCYPRTFGDEQLRGGQSYSAIAARDQGGFTLTVHLDPFSFRGVYQFGVSANPRRSHKKAPGQRDARDAPSASPPNTLTQS